MVRYGLLAAGHHLDDPGFQLTTAANRRAIHRKWMEIYPLLLARARLFCGGNREKAEDLVSRATLRLLRFAASHDRPLRHVGALFFLTLRNLAIDDHRGARRDAILYDRTVDVHDDGDAWRLPAAGADATRRLALGRALAAIEASLDRLPDDMRALFVHRFVDERPYGEIARLCGISEPLARKRVQKLRAVLADGVRPADPAAASRPRGSHVYLHELV